MPSVRCGGCQRFLAVTEAATCTKCGCNYHRACVALSGSSRIHPNWHCPECKKNLARDNGSETPVRNKDAAISKGDNLGDNKVTSPEERSETIIDKTHEIVTELKLFKEELREEMRSMFSELQHIRSDIAQLKNSIKSCNQRLDDMDTRICLLESKSKQEPPNLQNFDEVVANLKQELNDRDQDLLSNDVEIANLPEKNGENLVHTVQLIASKLGLNIDERDIVSAHRIGGRHINATNSVGSEESRSRQVAVRLARRHLRDQLLNNARVRRGATTADLGLTGTPMRFYVNERLTKTNRQLFRETRKAAQRVGWRFVWTKQGRIFARKQSGEPVCSIRAEKDIIRIFGKDKDN